VTGAHAPLRFACCDRCGGEFPTWRLVDGVCVACHPAAVTPRAWSAAYGENRWPQW
jgi:hypothetical protein